MIHNKVLNYAYMLILSFILICLYLDLVESPKSNIQGRDFGNKLQNEGSDESQMSVWA